MGSRHLDQESAMTEASKKVSATDSNSRAENQNIGMESGTEEAQGPTVAERAQIVSTFWSAPDSALFDQDIAAVVMNRSIGTLERMRSVGGGPEFYWSERIIQYRKADIAAWLDKVSIRAVNSRQARMDLAKKYGIVRAA